ncbi:MAG: MBOAT family protein [Flavipsychrobacter sp.]|nr:MBOAT family protein [Flavipsychrobacter sp.]
MLFNSLQFLVFFMVVTLWFFRLRTQRGRVWLLLLASCYFYLSFVPIYIAILGVTIVVDYFAGWQIEKSQGRARKAWLVMSLVFNIGFLAFFKYFNFFTDNINLLLAATGSESQLAFLKIALPIGLSFHTFQAMSYTIEVYRGRHPAERSFPVYALYVMFYPQLVAGPIERPQNVLPQLKEYREYDYSNVREGIARMLWGFFKKVVIADRLAIGVDYAFGHSSELSSAALFTGAVLYSFQIYCDFSGYSDIGIGAARVMNIKLMENFNQPYISKSITEFWSRWHISLSTWFRDYVYIPLGGNQVGEVKRKRNVFVVFLLSGLWHGANWTFVIWGGLHGLLTTILPGSKSPIKSRIKSWCSGIALFVVVTFFWIFFRAENVGHAVAYIAGIFRFGSGGEHIGLNNLELGFSLLLIAALMLREYFYPSHVIRRGRFGWYVALMVALCYWFGVFNENQFIYFQF